MVPINNKQWSYLSVVTTGSKVNSYVIVCTSATVQSSEPCVVDCYLHLSDRVCNRRVCMWIFALFAKFRTDGDACRQEVCICVCLFSWTNIDNGRQYLLKPLNEVVWSNSCDQFRARSANSPCRARAMYVDMIRIIVSLSLVWDESRCYQLAITLLVSHVHVLFRAKMTSS